MTHLNVALIHVHYLYIVEHCPLTPAVYKPNSFLSCICSVKKATTLRWVDNNLMYFFFVFLNIFVFSSVYIILWCFSNLHCYYTISTTTVLRPCGFYPGLPGWAGTRKVKTSLDLFKQEIVNGSGISWAICKSAPHPRYNSHTSIPPLYFLLARCPSCHPTNSIKALKEFATYKCKNNKRWSQNVELEDQFWVEAVNLVFRKG